MNKLTYLLTIILFMIEGAYAQKTVTIKDHHTQESIPVYDLRDKAV